MLGIGPDGGQWHIEVEHPLDEADSLFTATLDDSAIVTSSRLFRRWATSDGEAHHLIDPTTGASACSAVAAVVASARHAWYAEGIAKAAVGAGPQRGAAIASQSDATCWFVLDNGDVIEIVEREPAPC